MKTIQWGIIGCGNVTEVKSGPALQKADHSRLVAVMRRTGALAEDYARRHNVPKWYDQANALIHDPDVQAVYIATPPDSHLQYTRLCAKAGKPVYVEKPMARTYAECLAMREACREAGVPLFVAYYRRALPRFNKIREWIDSGAIGDIRSVNITLRQPAPSPDKIKADALPWRLIPEIAGGGYFVDLASHMLDFLDLALGPVKQASGFSSRQAGLYPAEDIVTGTWITESGIHGTGTWCFTAFDRLDLAEIIGSEGKISYATFGETPVVLTTADGVTEFPGTNPAHIQQPLIQTLVNELNGVGQCPSTGETAARTSRVMEWMMK